MFSKIQRHFSRLLFPLAIVLGLLAGGYGHESVLVTAETVSKIFVNLLKLVSLPIVFLSIVSTISGMQGLGELKYLGKQVIKYTLFTTVIAASIALCVFLSIDPVQTAIVHLQQSDQSTGTPVLQVNSADYLKHLIQIIPSNFLQPFVEGNVIGVLILAILISFAIVSLPTEKRSILHQFFSSLFAAVMKVTSWIVKLMPLAICAFVALFIRELNAGLDIKNIGLYLLCIVGANLIQAFIVLPTLLKCRGISPLKIAKGMFPALTVAFWSKSSSATLPIAMRCAEENLNLSPRVTRFSFPLCTTINMNACAAFILITVLFVSMSQGTVFTTTEFVLWIFIATIAAVGNAGIPMGCYFLASALLASLNVPLYLMGIILPFYSLIDMLETAINVWSDACVTTLVDQDAKKEVVEAIPVVMV